MKVISPSLTRQQRYTVSLILAALLIGCGILTGWKTRPGHATTAPSSKAWAAEAGEETQAPPQKKASEGDPGKGTPTASGGIQPGGEATRNKTQVIRVHVCGAVKSPGVYELPPGSRAIDAVKLAGGTTADADLPSINLAAEVSDGQQIYVPSKTAGGGALQAPSDTPAGRATGTSSPGSEGGTSNTSRDMKLNINSCSARELEALPGVGPVLARRIIDYRSANGPFGSPEELINVPGIGPKKLAALLPLIRVR